MYKHLTRDFFNANRERLRNLLPTDLPVVLTAHGQLQKSQDEAFGFRQDSNFLYLCGINDPDIVLVIDQADEYLILPNHDFFKEAFDGKLQPSQLSAISGIGTIYPAKAGWAHLSKRLKQAKQVATLTPPPIFLDDYCFYTNPARARLVQQMQAINPQLQWHDLRSAMAQLRMVKQPAELAAITDAINITIKTFKELAKRHYANEFDYEHAITGYFHKLGASGHGYDPIVAGGRRACTIHHFANNHDIVPGELLLIDVGAVVDHYCADITRTLALTPSTPRQQAVYEAVQTVHDFALSNLKPGLSLLQSERLVEDFMGQQLRQLGLIKRPDRQKVRHYLPHATSHFLGLDVHDIGDYQVPLEPNMVITVEPGIYIPEESIGIRLENDILITESGCTNLSAKLPNRLGNI